MYYFGPTMATMYVIMVYMGQNTDKTTFNCGYFANFFITDGLPQII